MSKTRRRFSKEFNDKYKFSPDLFTGMGNFSLLITVPAGRNGFQPELTLGYRSGNANCTFCAAMSVSIVHLKEKIILKTNGVVIKSELFKITPNEFKTNILNLQSELINSHQ